MIAIDDLHLQAGSFSVKGLTLRVPEGAYGVLMGRTGSGKTTLLEAVAGLQPTQSGTIRLNGRDVTHEKPAARGVGYVPQEGALFQAMRVREQLGFALRIRGRSKADIAERVGELARLLGIEPLLDRYPDKLSGGERQRVALGRALAFRPATLLLDEPLSALDEATRHQMYDLLRRVQRASGATTLHVTHSREEAEALADRVYRIEDGRIVEGDVVDNEATQEIQP